METSEIQGNTPLRLVLIGGGHANIQILKLMDDWRKTLFKSRSIEIVLISQLETFHYSGMISGCVARNYEQQISCINLLDLCEVCDCTLIKENVIGMDIDRRQIFLQGREPLSYHIAVVNIGSTVRDVSSSQSIQSVTNILPTRPISTFLQTLNKIEMDLAQKLQIHMAPSNPSSFMIRSNPLRIVVVGTGAAGIEMAFCFRERYLKTFGKVEVTIIGSQSRLLDSYPVAVGSAILSKMLEKSIRVLLNRNVIAVEESKLTLEEISFPNSPKIDRASFLNFDLCIWATGPAPPPVLANINAEHSKDGWLLVGDSLQSISSPFLFAAGDCISIKQHEKAPKAGVYAVREGQVIAQNIQSLIQSNPFFESDVKPPTLSHYQPQTDVLMLLNMGDGTAIGSKYGMTMSGDYVFRLKDYMDKNFMNSFSSSSIRKQREISKNSSWWSKLWT